MEKLGDILFIIILLISSYYILFCYPELIELINKKVIAEEKIYSILPTYSPSLICNNTELIINKQDNITCFNDCIKDQLEIKICINDKLLLAIYERGAELKNGS